MPIIDLAFELKGTSIPLDYGYALFGAISRIVPAIHGDRRVGVHPIRGIRVEPARLMLVRQSRLRLRLPSEEVAAYLPLAGSTLELDGDHLRVGIPAAEGLRPGPVVRSRLVTIGRLIEPAEVAESLRRQLSGLGVGGELNFLPSNDPLDRGGPARRVIRIKGKKIVGYPIEVAGLTAEESLLVQEAGLGSRRRMGCGVFQPVI